MPTIAQTTPGTVSAVWGQALIRGADGKMRPLKIGDRVNRGDVILTTQDGIVQITPEDVPARLAKLVELLQRQVAQLELWKTLQGKLPNKNVGHN